MDVVLLSIRFTAETKRACLRKPKWSVSIQDSWRDESRYLTKNGVVQNMHDFCVRVYVCSYKYVAICSRDKRRVAVRVHFIVWRRSPVLEGALYWGSGALDGAKNLSLRAGTDSQCIVGLLHLSFTILVIYWFLVKYTHGLAKLLARMNACFFPRNGDSSLDWCVKNGFAQHFIQSPGRRNLKVPSTTV